MALTFYFAIGFGILLSIDCYTNVPYRYCDLPHLMHLTRLDVIPCQSDICVLKRGENVTVIADFIPHINSSKLFIDVHQQDFYLPDLIQPVVLSKHDVCGKFNVECPAVAYEGQQTRFRVMLPSTMPKMKLWFKLVAFGDQYRQLFCIRVPLEIR